MNKKKILIALSIMFALTGCSVSNKETKEKVEQKQTEEARKIGIAEESKQQIEVEKLEKKEFRFLTESNGVEVYALNTEEEIVLESDSEKIGGGSFDGSKELGNIVDLKHTLHFSGVYQTKDKEHYQYIGSHLGEAFKISTQKEYKYMQEKRVKYKDEILIFCSKVPRDINNTKEVLVRKSTKTGMEKQYHFDDDYYIYIPEFYDENNSPYIYLYRWGENKNGDSLAQYKVVEIWKYDLKENTIIFLEQLNQEFSYANIAVNEKGEICYLLWDSVDNISSVYFSSNSYVKKIEKEFDIGLDNNYFPIYRKEGVYVPLGKPNIETETKDKPGLYLIKPDGSITYKGEKGLYWETPKEDKLIGMDETESYNSMEGYLEMYVGIYSLTDNSSEKRKIVYKPREIEGEKYFFRGWTYEDKTIYGFYVSEDEQKAIRIVVEE